MARMTLSHFPVIFKTLIHADLRLNLWVNFCRNPALFIYSLSHLPTFPLACAASAHPVAPHVQLHTLHLVARYMGGGLGCCWLLPVVNMSIKIYNS